MLQIQLQLSLFTRPCHPCLDTEPILVLLTSLRRRLRDRGRGRGMVHA